MAYLKDSIENTKDNKIKISDIAESHQEVTIIDLYPIFSYIFAITDEAINMPELR